MPVSTEQWAEFGQAVFEKLSVEVVENGWCELESDVLMAIAEDCGIAQRVEFDPEEHGEGGHVEARPGDEIWSWGEGMATAAMPPR